MADDNIWIQDRGRVILWVELLHRPVSNQIKWNSRGHKFTWKDHVHINPADILIKELEGKNDSADVGTVQNSTVKAC